MSQSIIRKAFKNWFALCRRLSLKNKRPKIGAGAAGVGGGTGLILLARNLPDASPWKSWLIIAAPTVTVLASSAWVWLKTKLENVVKAKQVDDLFAKVLQTLESALKNPNTSQ